MTVYLIRHGQTQGNLERRYIGSSDQPLCPRGREALYVHRKAALEAAEPIQEQEDTAQ